MTVKLPPSYPLSNKESEGIHMTKEETSMIGFEIVAFSGDARSKLLLAVAEAKAGDFPASQIQIRKAEECLNEAHKAQTTLLQKEASGENAEIGFIMMHAQDHLMTTLLLQDIILNLLDIYEK